jgi:glycosyltransferase-like protein
MAPESRSPVDPPVAQARVEHDVRHVALLMHSVLPRGGVVHTLELARALAALGLRVDVLAPLEPGQTLFRGLPASDRAPAAGGSVRFHPLPMAHPAGSDLRDQVAARIDALTDALPRWLAGPGQGVQLLHAQDSLNGQALARLRPALPWLRTVHHLDDFSDPDLAAWQDGAWRQADAVACVSGAWVTRLQALRRLTLCGTPPVHRVYNGVDLTRFALPSEANQSADAQALAALGLDPVATPLVLAVGGVEARKNSARLLAAFARLRHEVPAAAHARLVVAGGASLLQHGAELQRWTATLARCGLTEGPQAPVWRTGALADPLLPALMRQARFLAMPSLNEGFGLTAIEALACGTPVLVSDRAPFTEHLTGSPGVAWCDPENLDSVALGLARTWTLPRLRRTPSVCLSHDWARSAQGHLALYRSLRADPSGAAAFPTPRLPGEPDARHALHPELARWSADRGLFPLTGDSGPLPSGAVLCA